MQQIAAIGELSADSFVRQRANIVYELQSDEKSTHLSFSRKTLTFGPQAAAVIREIGARSGVQVAELLQHDEKALGVVRKLILEGFAVQVAPSEVQGRPGAVA